MPQYDAKLWTDLDAATFPLSAADRLLIGQGDAIKVIDLDELAGRITDFAGLTSLGIVASDIDAFTVDHAASNPHRLSGGVLGSGGGFGGYGAGAEFRFKPHMGDTNSEFRYVGEGARVVIESQGGAHNPQVIVADNDVFGTPVTGGHNAAGIGLVGNGVDGAAFHVNIVNLGGGDFASTSLSTEIFIYSMSAPSTPTECQPTIMFFHATGTAWNGTLTKTKAGTSLGQLSVIGWAYEHNSEGAMQTESAGIRMYAAADFSSPTHPPTETNTAAPTAVAVFNCGYDAGLYKIHTVFSPNRNVLIGDGFNWYGDDQSNAARRTIWLQDGADPDATVAGVGIFWSKSGRPYWRGASDTTGHQIVLPHVSNTFSATQLFTTSQQFQDTVAAASFAGLEFYKNRTATNGDPVGAIDFYGNNASAAVTRYAAIVPAIGDKTAGGEDGIIPIFVQVAGTLTQVVTIGGSAGGGVQIGSPTGGNLGTGTLNVATAIKLNNVAVPTISSSDTLSNKTLASPTVTGTLTTGGGSAGVANMLAVWSTNATQLPAPVSGTVIHVGGADATAPRIFMDAFGSFPVLTFRRANGTAASKSAVGNTDTIGAIGALGYKATAYAGGNIASIAFVAAESFTDSATGTKIQFTVTPVGATAQATALMLEADKTLTMYGRLALIAGATAAPSINLPAGSAPTSPSDGDMWRVGASLYLRDGGSTKSVAFT